MPSEWLLVGLAVIAEIAAALGLRFSNGFTK
ncbi:MAG: QacE family quaternary ammonium compound efflux SMR transporter, partial [Rhodospirillaceae bacterium]|nr:QacE family quaternary ammonium compound efflux SMR transporter [Rhodospirillaceae bacterium]